MSKTSERLIYSMSLSPGNTYYTIQALPYFLVEARQYNRLYLLLTNFDFIKVRILTPKMHRLRNLIDDYNLFFDPKVLNSSCLSEDKVQRLRAIQDALKLPDDKVLAAIQEILQQPT